MVTILSLFRPRQMLPGWRDARLEARDAALAEAVLLTGDMPLREVARLRVGDVVALVKASPDRKAWASLWDYVKKHVGGALGAFLFPSQKKGSRGEVRAIGYASAWRIAREMVVRVLGQKRVQQVVQAIRAIQASLPEEPVDVLAGVDLTCAPPDSWSGSRVNPGGRGF